MFRSVVSLIVLVVVFHGLATAARAQGSSKKGLQVENVEDALLLGIQHAALNLDLGRLLKSREASGSGQDPRGQSKCEAMTVGDFVYCLDRTYLQQLDAQIQSLSHHGVSVSVILLAYQSGEPEIDQLLIHPACIDSPPNRLGAFNTVSEAGRETLAAIVGILAERWRDATSAHGCVQGWIVGNEVNSHWWWYNMGEATVEEVADAYEQAVRIVADAVHQQNAAMRVYVSMEHHWQIRYSAATQMQACPGVELLDRFNAIATDRGNFDWHLAFHPYPENLFEPDFWNDQSATIRSDTDRITFRNLGCLLDYLNRPEFLFENVHRRVILSEQGFHSDGTSDGEQLQAAAYCLAYKIVESFDGIDAFILHRHIDHPAEGGLNLGLRRRADSGRDAKASFEELFPRKPIYACFKAAGTPGEVEAFQFALPIVGLEGWANLDEFTRGPSPQETSGQRKSPQGFAP